MPMTVAAGRSFGAQIFPEACSPNTALNLLELGRRATKVPRRAKDEKGVYV